MHYYRPTEIDEALTLLSTAPLRILAGGTDLYPATDRPQLSGDVLDITNLSALRGISQDAHHIRIGAATTWSDIMAADLPPSFDALKQSARDVGGIQIQNAGTIGGNLCNASPAADGVPPLLILDAEVELTSAGGRRVLPLRQFILGNRETDLCAGEIMTAVLIPTGAARGRSIFLKLGARHSLVISIVMVAARFDISDSRITDAALSLGACSPVARRLPLVEAALNGGSATNCPQIGHDLIDPELAPISDVRADAAYRGHAAAELVNRAIGGLTDGL